jgi:hypothetical protein
MAQKAKKDQAKANISALKNLHLTSLAINAAFLALTLVLGRRRSLTLYAVLSAPAFVAQFVLERSGRPQRDPSGALRSPGQDLAAEGLTAHMFDVVWVTWGALVLVALVGDWGWVIWSVVPAYGVYQGVRLFGKARGMAGGLGGAPTGTDAVGVPTNKNRKQRRAA